ncbi:cysteine desulfurase [Paenibacillus phyllosphaerae]|uniref:Cysteine desulfurase n=1 Tax=Paenibacillus phyllosphaerae TaxID=274593 RepID=A0A7W5AUH8_9BACL|nr:cysteine desulfurase family protein [Paenibacillus phyllosphaerae]MBB3109025.1 cysteine desulfurase [Paenibacillus phyllosphaerae]
MYYFDHSASSPPHEEVVRTLTEVMVQHYANPSSLHRGGQEASKLLERARVVIAKQFGTSPSEWVFTSGGTESNNAAILGAARQYRGRGRHLITTQIEHPSVYDTFKKLEHEGFRVTYLPVDREGRITADQVEQALTAETILVSVMHVNNETGAIQPIHEVGRLLKGRPRILFHVDGVQSVGKLPVSLQESGIDLFSASAHKIRGPRGVGLLYVRQGIELQPILAGGGQENGLRPGTENVAAIVAAAKAFRLAIESQPARHSQMSKLRRRLAEWLESKPQLFVNGGGKEAAGNGKNGTVAPHIINFSYPGMKPEVVVHMLEEHGILASTKSACSSKDSKPSRILEAMGCDNARASSGIRISFGDEHDEKAIDWLCAQLELVTTKLARLERKEERS